MLDHTALLWTYAAAGIFSFLTYCFALGIWRGRHEIAAGKNWAKAPGQIVFSRIEAHGSHSSDEDSDCSIAIRYRYTVDGKAYEGDRIRFGGSAVTTRMLAEQLVGKYPSGSAVQVFYDPKHPKNAVLESKSATSAAFIAAVVVFGSVAAVLIAHSIAGKVIYTANGVPVWVFLGPAGAAGVALLCLYGYFDIRRKERLSLHWPTAPGTITASGIAEDIETDDKGRQDTNYRVAIRYAYRIGGGEFHGSTLKWGFTELYPDEKRPTAIAGRYPKGKEVPVYYDPADPSVSVLEPANHRGNLAPLLGAIVFALPAGIFLWCFLAV